MLRIHFTGDDLGQLRVAAGPDLLWEILLSVHMLRSQRPAVTLHEWHAEARAKVTPRMRMLLHLAPPRGYSPDFLTPIGGTTDLATGLSAVLSTPRHRLRRDLSLFADGRAPAGWMRQLADGDLGSLDDLAHAYRAFYDGALAPCWDLINAAIDADRATRAEAFLTGGASQLLSTLHPTVRWRPPILEVVYPEDRDLYIDGRGLLLVPSFFCHRSPITVRDPALPPALVYPVQRDIDWVRPARATNGGRKPPTLAELLGRTRAAVLAATARGCTTSELSRYLEISAASASRHATILRENGLVMSRRDGNTVHHTLTPLGRRLLDGGRRASVPAV